MCERERVTSQHASYLNRGLCVCVCVCARERDRVTPQWSQLSYLWRVCKHILASSMCLSCESVPLSAGTDGKTKDIISCLYFYFES